MGGSTANFKILQKAVSIIVFILLYSGCEILARIPEVQIKKQNGEIVKVEVEIAHKPEERLLGLMYRKSLGKDKGMLFIFDQEQKQTFIMKNTFIPLDMIFIGRDKHIVGWAENARPLSAEQYSIEKPSQYVLEVNAFFCRNNDITIGDEVSFKNID